MASNGDEVEPNAQFRSPNNDESQGPMEEFESGSDLENNPFRRSSMSAHCFSPDTTQDQSSNPTTEQPIDTVMEDERGSKEVVQEGNRSSDSNEDSINSESGSAVPKDLPESFGRCSPDLIYPNVRNEICDICHRSGVPKNAVSVVLETELLRLRDVRIHDRALNCDVYPFKELENRRNTSDGRSSNMNIKHCHACRRTFFQMWEIQHAIAKAVAKKGNASSKQLKKEQSFKKLSYS